MLQSFNKLKGFKISGTDGLIGKCQDFLFDDQSWILRYIVIDTGGWLTGRKVVIAPPAFQSPDWDSGTLPVGLTRSRIENSPPIEAHAPVSRRREMELSNYYAWPNYWMGMSYAAGGIYPPQPVSPEPLPSDTNQDKLAEHERHLDEDRHLRSAAEVEGYGIQATDERIGHVEDFLVDDQGWEIRYLVIDTGQWLPGKKVLLAPQWANSVRWAERLVHVKVPRDSVRNAPGYHGIGSITPEIEATLDTHWQSGELH